ncbi:hypothetical protein [Endozoicomonas sp. SCSIO W0465]|uniref:hypothetical protein n=1 Tax=Endozoicomonas sp. SCSIO W0465 TaxID=2918516 RepID=UPI002074E3F6|nr:hypothetical protein [Endozoicomonas sp. SCSIO W0465]USE39544.1 hypothetical protein MJO57_16080 [Endozoicomonas sp. SCSIO W0465]
MPKKTNEKLMKLIVECHKAGISKKYISESTGIARSTIDSILKKYSDNMKVKNTDTQLFEAYQQRNDKAIMSIIKHKLALQAELVQLHESMKIPTTKNKHDIDHYDFGSLDKMTSTIKNTNTNTELYTDIKLDDFVIKQKEKKMPELKDSDVMDRDIARIVELAGGTKEDNPNNTQSTFGSEYMQRERNEKSPIKNFNGGWKQ